MEHRKMKTRLNSNLNPSMLMYDRGGNFFGAINSLFMVLDLNQLKCISVPQFKLQ